jgi:hypothetical protein
MRLAKLATGRSVVVLITQEIPVPGRNDLAKLGQCIAASISSRAAGRRPSPDNT